MTTYAVKRQIAAPPERVWTLLTDAARYSDWNTAVVSIDGAIEMIPDITESFEMFAYGLLRAAEA